jgi:hypothetical protein
VWNDTPGGVQVFILAGQSNMVGHGNSEKGHDEQPGGIGSLRYLVKTDPKTFGRLVDPSGNWIVRDDVKVWWRDSDIAAPRSVIKGNLRIGYAQSRNPEWIGKGYHIAGVGWHQGWNDRVDKTASDHYEANLADFITDLRAEFSQPKLAFSITTTGMAPTPEYTKVEVAQLAVGDPTKHPEFAGTVRTTDTRPFWRPAEVSPSGMGYHWNHNGESQFLNGTAMGRAMVDMLSQPQKPQPAGRRSR